MLPPFDVPTGLMEAAVSVAGAATPFLGIVGVIIGATVTGVVSRGNDRRRVVTDIRREVYFETMDVAVKLFEQLGRIRTNGPRGADDAEADSAAAKAIERLIRLSRELLRLEARVATVGSPAVVEATYSFRRATDEFMTAVFSQRMFRVGVALRHAGAYAETLDRLAQAIRADLGLTGLNAMLPVAREAVERVALLPPPSWHPDPTGRYEWRWWNGSYWGEEVATDGVANRDPELVRTAF